MKKDVRLYNIILPIWLLVLVPSVWLVVIPGNLAVDCLVLWGTLAVLKHTQKKAVVKQLWWKFWLLGFAADGVGILCLLSALIPMGFPGISETGYEDQILAPLMGNCFRSLPALVWTLAAIALAGVCIYAFDKRAMARCQLLSEGEKHRIALAMAVITAPWLFLVPMY